MSLNADQHPLETGLPAASITPPARRARATRPDRAARPGRPRPAGRPRDGAAVAGARLAAVATRLTGRHATSVPGLVAERVAPGVASRLAAGLDGCCLISGTNGKTSTARFLAHLLEADGRPVVANPSGANLEQGMASALVAAADLAGRVREPGSVAVLESDEAVLPAVARHLTPTVVVVTNLFRDQLDRFGETDHLVRLWAKMLAELPPAVTVVYCADDPRLAALLAGREGAIGYAMVRPRATAAAITPDVSLCPVCGDTSIAFAWSTVGHLGDYRCSHCGFERPAPELEVASTSGALYGQTLTFRRRGRAGRISVGVPFPGLGNAYNAAAAVTAAVAMGVDLERAVASLAGISVPFGRFEELAVDGRRVMLSLVKNAASMAEVARVAGGAPVDTMLLAFSDNFQDGRDVSWYWDADPTPMIHGRPFVISGSRARDVAVHLKYALQASASTALPGCLGVRTSPVEGLALALEATPQNGLCFVASTYTALLSLRTALERRGLAVAMPR